MSLFANFLDSDAFFPILIVSLLVIVFIFVYVIYSGRKQEKILKEKKMRLLESAEKIELENNEIEKKEEVKDEQSNDDIEEKTQVFDFDLSDIEEKTVSFEPITIYEQEELIKDDKEEIEIPNLNEEKEENNNEEVIEDVKEEIKEDVKEEEKLYQYTSEKTEVFDFPDFSDIINSDIANAKLSDLKDNIAGVSEDVLKEANKYIEEIMHSEEN